MTKEYLENQFKNYQDVVGTYVTPEMFGAKGDGVTDDTEAIAAMFASGKNVFVSEGIYLVKRQINISHSVIIDGAGKQKAVIKADQNFDYSISNTPVFMRVYADSIISNIGIVMEYDSSLPYPSGERTLLGAMKAASVTIDNCWFKAVRSDSGAEKGTSLVWGRGAKVLEVRNCLLQNYTNAKTGGCLWSFNWSDSAVGGENSIVADRIIFDNNIIEHTCWDEAIGVWTYNDATKPVWKNVQITNNFITQDSFVENVEAYTNDNLISVNANQAQEAWNYSPVLIQGNTLIANYDCRCFIKARCNMDGLLIKDNYLADNSIVRNSYYANKQIRMFLIDSCHDAKIINNTVLSSSPRFDNFGPMFIVNGHVSIEGNAVSSKYGYFTLQFQGVVVSDYEETFGVSVKTIRNNNITTPNFSIYPLGAQNTIYFEDNNVNNFASTTVYLAGFKYIDWYIKRNKFAPNSVLRSPLIIDGGSFHFIDNINYSIRVFESKLTSKWNELEFRGAQQTFEVASEEGKVPYENLTEDILKGLANIVTVYQTKGGAVRGKAVVIGDSYFDGDANYNFADHLRSKNIYEEVVDYAEGGSGFGKTYTDHQTLYEKLQGTQMRADIANADVIYMHLGGNDLLSAMPGASHAVAEPDIYLRVQESLAEIHTINPDVTVYYIPALDYKAVQSTFICPAIAGETIPLLSRTITKIDAFKAALINFIIDAAIADSGLKVYRLDIPSCYLVEELSSDGLHPTPSAASSMFDAFINGNYNDIILRDFVMPATTQATITVAASVSATFLQNLETLIGSLILKRKLSKASFRFLTQITVVDQSTDHVMFVDLNGIQLSNYGYVSLLPYPDSERLTFVRMTTAAGDLDMDVSNVDLRPMNENIVPTTDGTYKMKVEHVNGVLRYSWVAE